MLHLAGFSRRYRWWRRWRYFRTRTEICKTSRSITAVHQSQPTANTKIARPITPFYYWKRGNTSWCYRNRHNENYFHNFFLSRTTCWILYSERYFKIIVFGIIFTKTRQRSYLCILWIRYLQVYYPLIIKEPWSCIMFVKFFEIFAYFCWKRLKITMKRTPRGLLI